MPHSLRHAVCNEVFESWPFADACRAIRQAGYTGIEIATFTLAEDPPHFRPRQRREYRDIMASEGLQFVGPALVDGRSPGPARNYARCGPALPELAATSET